MISRRWVLVRHFQGLPKPEDYQVISEPIPRLRDGEILIKSKYWGIDPFQRVYPKAYKHKLPCTIIGGVLAEVLESKHPGFPEGCKVINFS